MKFVFYCLLTILLAGSAFARSSNKIDMYGRHHYSMALGVTNPLSAFTKYGGQLESRIGSVSYIVSYTKYIGAYPGTQSAFEFQKYLRTRRRDQYYLYLRSIAGDAGFDSRKLSIYGDQTNILIGEFDENKKFKSGNSYAGFALGFGKRYNFNVFFIRWNCGVKACALIGDYSDDIRHAYRLMYATGPASILEFNVHLGLQI